MFACMCVSETETVTQSQSRIWVIQVTKYLSGRKKMLFSGRDKILKGPLDRDVVMSGGYSVELKPDS